MTDQADIAEHMAVTAWQTLHPESKAIFSVSTIQPHYRKSTVVRLDGVTGYEGSIMAKRCPTPQARIEHLVYTKILSQIPYPALHSFGMLEGPSSGYSWLFIEEAVGEDYSYKDVGHRSLAAEWLGVLHVTAAKITAQDDLPARDIEHYLGLTSQARKTLEESSANPALTGEQLQVINDLRKQSELLQSRISEIQPIFDGIPKTIVHGGFYGKNVRVGWRQGRQVILAYDWESAGWGCPAIDLAFVDLGLYQAQCSAYGLDLSLSILSEIAVFGKMLWVIKAIPGERQTLASPWLDKVMSKFAYYRDEMNQAMQIAAWE